MVITDVITMVGIVAIIAVTTMEIAILSGVMNTMVLTIEITVVNTMVIAMAPW